MKIIRLTAENIKKLTAVEITPDGNMVQITGKNGQGKTSVLDAIWWALTGTDHIQKQPIRNGAEKARIELQLGANGKTELIVERRFTEENSYLTVKTADGAKYPSPQKLLDDMLGSLSFDPLAFMRQAPKDQFEVLRRMVKLDIDPDELDRLSKADFEQRTGVNRDAKAKRAQAAAIMVPEGLPDAPVDESALLDLMQQASDKNTDLERRKVNRVAAEQQIVQNNATVLNLLKEAAKLTADAADLEEASKGLRAKLDAAEALPDPIDVSKLRSDLEGAKSTNAGIAARTRKAEIDADAAELEKLAEDLTANIEKRKAQKLAAIEKAQMPVAGLSFGDGAVTFKGLPLDQASDAEQLTVSMAIAAALNPKLRVLRIRDGSLLDDDAMKRLATFAEERDLQCWIEVVGSGGVGFEMVDGHVKGQDKAAEEAPKPKAKTKKEAA